MDFSAKKFTDKQKIQLLQRSILVNSYAYYELNENILSDFQYDANTRQLLELKETAPEAYSKSRYRKYFDNFESGTGFDLTSRLKANRQLYQKVSRDAHLALKLKGKMNGKSILTENFIALQTDTPRQSKRLLIFFKNN